MADLKVLVIGSSGHAHVQCVSWQEASAVNIADFDAAVVNVRSLSDKVLQTRKVDFEAIRRGLSRMLVSLGNVIVLGVANRRVKIRDHDYVNLWGWSPV